jgi:hypothetical protein
MRSVAGLIAIALAVLATTALAAPPGGSPGNSDSRIGVAFTDDPAGDDVFSGEVSSENRECEQRRTVTVYRKKRKRPKKVGTTITGTVSAGGFELFKEDPKDGKYYAKVAEARIGPRTTCAGAKSPKIRVDDDPAV